MVRSLDDTKSGSDAQAMLDSMPVEAVLINRDGLITAVNAHWDRFAEANGYPDGSLGLGSNYLLSCVGATAEPPLEGRIVAEGLNDLLSGRIGDFSTVYPCHSPTERRWFRLIAARSCDGGGAVVLHFNITPEMLAEERLVGDRIAVERRLARIETAMREGARSETRVLADAVKDGGNAPAAIKEDPRLAAVKTRYRAMLHALMGAQIYRRQRTIRDEARAIAVDLAAAQVDAAAVAGLHAESLTAVQAGVGPEKAGWVAHESRLGFIAVLGHLADLYRDEAIRNRHGAPHLETT